MDRGSAASPASTAAGVGVVREQLVIFLADALRGTAEERAPLVLTMSQPGAVGGTAGAVSARQVTEVSRSVALKPERQLLEHLSSSSSLICCVFWLALLCFILVSRRPHFICGSDSGTKRPSARLATGADG